jgi:hypothetical protein
MTRISYKNKLDKQALADRKALIDQAYAELPVEQKGTVDGMVKTLMLIRGVGEDGAKEVLFQLAKFLRGVTR